MFSDGINEGRSTTGEEYGMERFAASLKPGSPRRTLSLAWQSWSAFADTDDLHDDACLTVFGCRPAHTLNLLSSPAQCKRCRQFVESWTRYVGFDDLTRGQIQLAVDEAITNIMRHTYQQREGEKIDITVELDEQYLTFRLRDYGPTLDPNKLQKKELSDVRPGGLGLPLLDMTFTTVRFLPHEPGNELVLSKPTP
jgi:anti-sigma regulatory factor (Ser/Thr protein kinase)